MAKTNLVENFLTKDLDLFETIDDDAASKVVGGVLPCTEESRSRVLAGFQASGLITAEQVTTLSAIPLADFCTDVGEFLEARLGVQVFQDITAAVEVEPNVI